MSSSMAETLHRKVGFSVPSLTPVTQETAKQPLPPGLPAKLGHLGLPQHWYHNSMRHHSVTELFEVAGKVPGGQGRQNILLGQEKDISSQIPFFKVIFSERMKETKSYQQNLYFFDLKKKTT